MSQQWWAVSLILISLAFLSGWAWLTRDQANSHFWHCVQGQWPDGLARFFYFVGLPYIAVISGIITTRLLGLKGLEHLALVGLETSSGAEVLVEICSTVMVMLFDWMLDLGVTLQVSIIALAVLAGVWLSLAKSGLKGKTVLPVSILSTFYHALHWAYYRAIFWLITDDLYLGVILGAGFVILEWILVAWLHKNWHANQEQLLVNVIILILTSAIFFYNANLWLLWPVHAAMVFWIQNVNSSGAPEQAIRKGISTPV
jgi:hypothetical protein